MRRPLLVISLLSAVHAFAAEAVQEVVSGAADREAIAITIYNDDLALIKERRHVIVPSRLVRLSLREVSAQMRPETALLRAVSGTPITLLEQDFDFDLLTPGKLLEKYVGRSVTVIRTHPTTGEERREQATVLAANEGTVLRFADRIETGVPGRIVFDSVPTNLRDRPTLSVLMQGNGGKQSLELSYLTSGLAWKADYVAKLSPDGRQIDLSGWVTLVNHSGAGYDNVSLELVAGTLNRVRSDGAFNQGMVQKASRGMARSPEVGQEILGDYHLYSFSRPTSIADNQTKQLALLSASAVSARREYMLVGNDWYYRERHGQIGQKIKPAVFLEFANKEGQLGKPLPGGVIRVYAKDSRGADQFIGEDRISHTPKNELVRLKLGEAFDITADRVQTSFRRLDETSAEASFRIDLRNAKDEPVTVRIQEPFPGDWEILQETHTHTKESARLAGWRVTVPADGTATLQYTVRTRW